MKKIFAGLVAVTFMLGACSSDDDADSGSARSDLLKYVPADSPYVFASTRPMPDDVADKIEPTADKILKTYQKVARLALQEHLDKMAAQGADDEETARTEAVADEVLALMSIEGIRGAGIGRESLFALYGNGLLPVLRLELTDADLFDETIARLESKSGKSLATAGVDGHQYRYVDLDKVKLIIATLDGHVVVTGVPAAFSESQVSVALGISAPAESIADTGALGKIQKQYDFMGFMTGYIDIRRISRIMTGAATGLDEELFAALEYTAPDLSDVCQAELANVVNIAPRMVFGYSEFNEDYVDSAAIIEMREDIAAGLATLPTPVPGLGVDNGDFLSMGFSIDLLKARDFVEARVTALEENPFECEMFANLQSMAAQGRAMLTQPVPPVAYSFQGFLARLSNLDGIDFTSPTPPESIDATITLAIKDAASLISMGAMFAPELASLNLTPDGNAVELTMSQLSMIADEAYAAMLDDVLAISLGDGAKANAENALHAKSGDPAPFMSMTMDAARYYELMGDMMMKEQPGRDGDAMSLEMRETLREVMILSGSIYERMVVDMHFTSRGIEMDAHMTFAD